MRLPTYSVVIPCYNVAAYVRDAVLSSANQTHAPREIVCVDDGSTDGTLDILEQYASRHPAVKVITQANQGANAARNAGLVASKGEWIQFLDADDLLHPEKVATQLGRLQADPTVGLVCGSYERISTSGKSVVASGGTDDDWIY